MNCKNCDQIIDGNFCAHCGQSTKVDKITFSTFIGELSSSIFQINRGFLFTLKELFIRPGHSIREYLEGKRKNHFKPIAYAFTLSTIYFLLSQLVDGSTLINYALEGFWNYGDKSQATIKKLATENWFAKNYAYTTLLLLPLFSLSTYLVFLRKGFNYLEHFVLNAYITGQQVIFYLLPLLISFTIGDNNILFAISLFSPMVYALLVFWQFFSIQNRLKISFRLLLAYLLYFIMVALIVGPIVLHVSN